MSPTSIIVGIIMFLTGVFAGSIPFLKEQGAATTPGLIGCGVVCFVLGIYPMFRKSRAAPKRTNRY